MSATYKSEADLQSQCTLWYKNDWCGNDIRMKKRLILIYNNPANARLGAILKSLGLERGATDQLFFSPIGVLVWIEYKLGNMKQSDDQIMFEEMLKEYSICVHVVIREKIDFQNLIKKHFYGIRQSESY